MFSNPPGSDDICKICFWQDDFAKLRFPDLRGGPSAPSLIEAQRNFADFGACEERVLKHVRRATVAELRDPEWRPFDPSMDNLENSPSGGFLEAVFDSDDYPADLTRLYYWRSDYWRRRPN